MDQVSGKLDELKQEETEKTLNDSDLIALDIRLKQEQALYNKNIQINTQDRKNVATLPLLVQKIRDEYLFFGTSAMIYAVFYTICLYKNPSGITAPLFTLGTLWYFYLCLKKLEIRVGKERIFYAGSILLLGVNLCLTDDEFLIFCDYVGIFLLLVSGLLHLFYEDKNWGLPEYLNAIGQAVFGAAAYMTRPLEDRKVWKSQRAGKKKQNPVVKYVLWGVLTGLPLLIVVLVLLVSADSVFGELFGRVFDWLYVLDKVDGIGDIIGILLMMTAVYLLSYGLLVKLGSKSVKVSLGKRQTGEPVVAITVNAMLGVVYLVFSMIQILYLFMGRLSLPEGTTYAEYARQGFFQLLLVCMINMVLVLFCLYKFRESRVLKGMLALISGCTYIMIASSALRMYMYVESYDLSYLRILVFWTLGLIFLVMSGILCYLFHRKFPLFKYCMVVVTVLYLGLAYARPDYLIASYNLNEQHINEHVDYRYLRSLSADAAPAFVRALEREGDGTFDEDLKDLLYVGEDEEFDLRGFNFSRYYRKSRK